MTLDIDWRKPENRLEGFSRYYYWRIVNNDLDHGHWLKHCSKDLDLESRLWMAHLFGQTYSVPLTYAFYQHHPTISDINRVELKNWNDENYARSKYATDTKYNKGYFSRISESYFDWLDANSQESKLSSLDIFSYSLSPSEKFKILHKESLSWYKFGNMTSWLYCQAVNDIVPEIKIDPGTVFIEGSGNTSVWNGLMFLLNREDQLVGDKYEFRVTRADKNRANDDVLKVAESITSRYGIEVDFFKLESALCQYKKMHFGRDYPGHTSGDFHDRGILFESELFPELDWTKYREANRALPEITRFKHQIKKDNMHFKETGELMNLHTVFDDMKVVTSTEKNESKLFIPLYYR